MKILGLIFITGTLITLIRLLSSMNAINRITRELNKLINENGIHFKSYFKGLRRIREQHEAINSEASRQLLVKAETIAPIFVRRFRLFLIFFILSGIVAIAIK